MPIRRYPQRKGDRPARASQERQEKKASSPTPSGLQKDLISNEPAPLQNRALSVRQPYAEQILRGTKKIEYRTRPTHIRGRVYLYASLTPALRAYAKMGTKPGDFLTGVIVGTVEIVDCTDNGTEFEWHLAHPERVERPVKPERHPQPSWFKPFEG